MPPRNDVGEARFNYLELDTASAPSLVAKPIIIARKKHLDKGQKMLVIASAAKQSSLNLK